LDLFQADPLRFLENECRGRDLIPLAYLPSLVLHSVLIRFFKRSKYVRYVRWYV
jgi:hypothetical protein